MNRSLILLAVPVAVGALSLSACSASDWEYTAPTGTIVELEHEESYQDSYTCTDPATGRSKTCYKWVPECYEVDFVSDSGYEHEDCTTAAMFAQLEVGMLYTQGQTELTSPSPSPSPSVSASASA